MLESKLPDFEEKIEDGIFFLTAAWNWRSFHVDRCLGGRRIFLYYKIEIYLLCWSKDNIEIKNVESLKVVGPKHYEITDLK